METSVMFFTVAAIMVLSFLGDWVSRRILLPNVILLIVVGVVFGPVLGVFDRSVLVGVVPFLAPLTIAFIGFDAGLRLDFYEVLAQSRRAVFLSVFGFLLSMGVVGVFLRLVFGLGWGYALLLSSAWGGVNLVTVLAVSRYLRLAKKMLTTLTVSALVDDLVVLVAALLFLDYVTLAGVGVWETSLEIVRNLSVSVFLGVVVGVGWLYVLYFSRRAEYTYTFMLAAVLGVYSGTELLGGTGGIAIFLFGLILGNSRTLAGALRMRVDGNELLPLRNLIIRFHSELTFILTTFFFVFIGLIYVFTGWFEVLVGLVISLLLHVTRLVAVRVGTWKSELARESPAVGLVVGKGVAAAAMSTLPLAYGLPNADLYSSIALNVILFTNVVSIVLPVVVSRASRK